MANALSSGSAETPRFATVPTMLPGMAAAAKAPARCQQTVPCRAWPMAPAAAAPTTTRSDSAVAACTDWPSR